MTYVSLVPQTVDTGFEVGLWQANAQAAKETVAVSNAELVSDVLSSAVTGAWSELLIDVEQTAQPPVDAGPKQSNKDVTALQVEMPTTVAEHGAAEAVFRMPAMEPPNDLAKSIIRNTFVSRLLANLKAIQNQCGTASCAAYARELLHDMRSMRDLAPFDPLLKVVMALYDAMAVDNQWADYDASQYEQAHNVLKAVAQYASLDGKRIGKAILALEAAGFDTLPFCITLQDCE